MNEHECEKLQGEIASLRDRLSDERSTGDPLAEAFTASLEAAHSILNAMTKMSENERNLSNECFQEALRATRAATLTIRFAIIDNDTAIRRHDRK